MIAWHCAQQACPFVHEFVKCTQLTIPKLFISEQIPLPSTVVIAPIVLLSWEVDPFRMTEFIAHKVQVALSTKRLSQKSNHFVQSHSPIDFKTRLVSTHLWVNLLIEKPHGDGFVTYNCLVVWLSIPYALLFPASVCHTVRQMAHVPVLIRGLFKQLDPKVWQKHAQSVVKTDTTFLYFPA